MTIHGKKLHDFLGNLINLPTKQGKKLHDFLGDLICANYTDKLSFYITNVPKTSTKQKKKDIMPILLKKYITDVELYFRKIYVDEFD